MDSSVSRERRDLVSAHVPSRFKRCLRNCITISCCACNRVPCLVITVPEHTNSDSQRLFGHAPANSWRLNDHGFGSKINLKGLLFLTVCKMGSFESGYDFHELCTFSCTLKNGDEIVKSLSTIVFGRTLFWYSPVPWQGRYNGRAVRPKLSLMLEVKIWNFYFNFYHKAWGINFEKFSTGVLREEYARNLEKDKVITYFLFSVFVIHYIFHSSPIRRTSGRNLGIF